MTITHSAMHHDPSAAALAVAEYEAAQRRTHDAQQRRNVQLYTLGRVFVAALFIASAAAKLVDYSGTLAALDDAIAAPRLLLPAAIAIELVGGVLLLVGFQARRISKGLIAYLGTVTLLLNHDLSNPMNRSIALANLAFAGALLMIIAHGAGAGSVDRARGE